MASNLLSIWLIFMQISIGSTGIPNPGAHWIDAGLYGAGLPAFTAFLDRIGSSWHTTLISVLALNAHSICHVERLAAFVGSMAARWGRFAALLLGGEYPEVDRAVFRTLASAARDFLAGSASRRRSGLS